jgi:hypothetical protein
MTGARFAYPVAVAIRWPVRNISLPMTRRTTAPLAQAALTVFPKRKWDCYVANAVVRELRGLCFKANELPFFGPAFLGLRGRYPVMYTRLRISRTVPSNLRCTGWVVGRDRATAYQSIAAAPTHEGEDYPALNFSSKYAIVAEWRPFREYYSDSTRHTA